MKTTIVLLSAVAVTAVSCKKKTTEPEPTVDQKAIVSEMALNVNYGTYSDLALQTEALYTEMLAFVAAPSQNGLDNCRQLWRDSRAAWEKSEGFLYGPVATENIDPRIDTWPVDFTAINNLLAGTTDFSVDANIDALDDALKGFHPIEFILWGENGDKVPGDFTQRELEYVEALAKNLKSLTSSLETEWNEANSGVFIGYFTTPSSSNAYYGSLLSVYEEIVNSMIGICDEVASGKIGDPFILQDASLEESPYAQNSISDFTNNIVSIENVYIGNYAMNGLGIEDLVREYNLSLDNTIKTKINTAKAALNAITLPFGEAIFNEQVQVQNAIDAIEDLKETLETELLPFVQQHVIE